MSQVMPTGPTDVEASREVRENKNPEQDVEHLERECPFQEGREDNEQDGCDIECEQRVPEAVSARVLGLVVKPKLVLQRRLHGRALN
jgi:hypothetical protein